MYIDFAYYLSQGGTIDDGATFDSYNQKAQNYVDYYTFDRLSSFDEIPDKVKTCVMSLISALYSLDQDVATYEGKTASGISNSGISVSFPTVTTTQHLADVATTVENIIEVGLYGVRTEKGLQVTYRGI